MRLFGCVATAAAGADSATQRAAVAWRNGERARREDLLAARLPATEPGFTFEAFLEFAYLSDYWQQPKARIFNRDPLGAREKVEQDIEKIGAHLAAGACRVGYVIVFEECDHEFPRKFLADAEARNGCRVRLIRGYS